MSRVGDVIKRGGEAFVDAFVRSMEFSGRSSRADFWGFTLICFVVSLAAVQLDKQLHLLSPLHGLGWLTLMTSVMTLLPQTTLMVRRLHDANFSGWWAVVTIIPLFGLLAVLVFATLPSSAGVNRFGAQRHVAVPELAA